MIKDSRSQTLMCYLPTKQIKFPKVSEASWNEGILCWISLLFLKPCSLESVKNMQTLRALCQFSKQRFMGSLCAFPMWLTGLWMPGEFLE